MFQLSKAKQVYYKGKPLGTFDAIIPRIASHMTKYGTCIVRQLEKCRANIAFLSLARYYTRTRQTTLHAASS